MFENKPCKFFYAIYNCSYAYFLKKIALIRKIGSSKWWSLPSALLQPVFPFCMKKTPVLQQKLHSPAILQML